MLFIIAEKHYDNSGLVTCAASSDVSVNSNSRWQILDTNLLY